ncbi:unnamed protein product [Alopecurus aequalis]
MDDSSGASAAAAPSSSSSQRYSDWVMLDPHNLLLECPKDHFRSTSADAMTSKGELIRVSLCAVPPPEVSRLSVSCTRSKNSWYEQESHSQVVAAHDNFILLSQGRRISSRDRYLDASHAEHTPMKAALYEFRSCGPGCNWKATEPRILHKKGQGSELTSWSTNVVVPCVDSLCYMDYSRGILFLDILSRCPELRYVRLPTVKIPSHLYDRDTFAGRGGRGWPEERSLCATNGGHTVKFVEIVTSTVFISRTRATASALFTIKVWRLRLDDKDMTWEKESELEDADLWTQPGYGDLLRVAPTFPRLSMEEPNVIYFVLSNHRQDVEDETWVIIVDMLNKTL